MNGLPYSPPGNDRCRRRSDIRRGEAWRGPLTRHGTPRSPDSSGFRSPPGDRSLDPESPRSSPPSDENRSVEMSGYFLFDSASAMAASTPFSARTVLTSAFARFDRLRTAAM